MRCIFMLFMYYIVSMVLILTGSYSNMLLNHQKQSSQFTYYSISNSIVRYVGVKLNGRTVTSQANMFNLSNPKMCSLSVGWRYAYSQMSTHSFLTGSNQHVKHQQKPFSPYSTTSQESQESSICRVKLSIERVDNFTLNLLCNHLTTFIRCLSLFYQSLNDMTHACMNILGEFP